MLGALVVWRQESTSFKRKKEHEATVLISIAKKERQGQLARKAKYKKALEELEMVKVELSSRLQKKT